MSSPALNPATAEALRPVPAVAFDPAQIPEILRQYPQWVCWRYEKRDGRWTKVPVDAKSSRRASTTDPATWSTFDAAVRAYNTAHYAGIGFVFAADDPFVGVDLDDCIVGGDIAGAALEIIRRFGTYAEISPSGAGVKIIGRGRKSPHAKCRSKDIPGFGEIEVYDVERFFAVTGRLVSDLPPTIQDCQGALDELCDRLWPVEQRRAAPPSLRPPAGAHREPDDEIIDRARRALNGAKFARLWSGDASDYGHDESRADLGLCRMLAFWLQKDAVAIDRLFRRSGLYREKWERRDYRERTIAAAIESCATTYACAAVHNSHRAQIVLGADEHRVVDEVIATLAADPDLYQRGRLLVRMLRRGGEDHGVVRPLGSPVISILPKATLRERISKYSDVRTRKDGELRAAHPPPWLVAAIDARADWPGIRPLHGISEVPVLRPDGSVWQERGYDAMTGVIFEPQIEFSPVPARASIDDARRAVQDLLEVVADFRFESEYHRAAWLAAILTPLARASFSGPSPLFLIDANVRGAGKGLLAQTVAEIVLGRPMPVSTYSHEQEEMRKRITAIAIAGDQMVLLDNLVGVFGNAALDGALTTTRWRDRVLGRSEQVDLPLTLVWYATGNNVLVGADTARRVVHIRLDVLEERPEERSDFEHPDLIGWIRDNRSRFVMAALTILSAYYRAGTPPQKIAPMGSFEGWSGLVRGALVWAGQPDPYAGTKMLAESTDTVREMLVQLFQAIRLWDPARQGFVVAEVLAALYPRDRESPSDDRSIAMRAALEVLAGSASSRQPTPRQVGNRLKAYRRRVVEGAYLDQRERRSTGGVWRLHEEARGPAQKTNGQEIDEWPPCAGPDDRTGNVSDVSDD